MKRAATHLFKRQSKNRAFFLNYRTFTLIEDPLATPRADPRARQRSENSTPGATGMCESRRSPGGDGQAWNWLIHNCAIKISGEPLISLCKIRFRHPRKLKLTGLIAYIMFHKICKFESSTIINDVITKNNGKIWCLTLTSTKFDPDNQEIWNLER